MKNLRQAIKKAGYAVKGYHGKINSKDQRYSSRSAYIAIDGGVVMINQMTTDELRIFTTVEGQGHKAIEVARALASVTGGKVELMSAKSAAIVF